MTIGTSLISIGAGAFYWCTLLTEIIIPNSVITIGNWAFGYDSSLISVAIPNSVTTIGDNAFYACTSLTKITIPESVIAIGVGVFGNDISLSSVMVPNSVTSIADGAFSFCSGLTSVIIGNSVISLGGSAFWQCQSLTSITLPNSVTSIGVGAFYGSGLNAVYFRGNAPNLGFEPFAYTRGLTVYYLPGTTGWPAASWGLPEVLWIPRMQTTDVSFGVRTNQFGFNINWASGMVVVVEGCTNLANPVWSPLSTNTLIGGSSYFSDPQWTNYPARFYRLRSP